MLQIGSLRHRITLQYTTSAADGMGGFTDTWTDFEPDIWAAIWPISAKEQIQSMHQTMEVTHRIRIRYRSDIDNSYRIKYGSRYFNIVSIINHEERDIMLDLMCKEVQ